MSYTSEPPHGGEHVAAVLKRHGIKVVFTLCGGHISPILVAAKQAGIRVVDVRDEATAAFAADAHSRFSGIPGIAIVTAGPGLTNTITAVKNAQLAQSSMIVIAGAAATMLKGRGALQDIDQIAVMKPHVKWAKSIKTVREIVPSLEKAFSISQSDVPGPVFIEIPVDLVYQEKLIRNMYLDTMGSGRTLAHKIMKWYINRHLNKIFNGNENIRAPPPEHVRFPIPDKAQVEKTGELLEKAERPILLIGSGSIFLTNQILNLQKAVSMLQIPTYLSGMARGLLGKQHPLQVRHKRRSALKEADLIILAGVPFDFRLNYGFSIRKSTKIISINRSRRELTLNRKPTLKVHADPALFLNELAAESQKRDLNWPEWMNRLRNRDLEREQEINRIARMPTEFANPLKVCQVMEDLIAEKSVIIGDGGDFVATASYIIRPRAPLTWLDPGVFGTLGCGAGFALASKILRSDHETWIIYGDGAFGYSLIEFDTFVRHDVPVIAVIGNDAAWMQIAREQVEIFKDDVSVALSRTNYHIAAKSLGTEGLIIHDNNEIKSVLTEAKDIAFEGKPVVINALIGKTSFRKGSISM